MTTTLALTAIYLTAALIGATAAVIVWLRRAAAAAALPLAGMLAAAAFWAFCDAIEAQLTTVDGKQLISQFQYFGVVSAGPFFFHAAMVLARLERNLSRAVKLAVWGVPVVSLILAWTSDWHRWLWQTITIPDTETNVAFYHYGWWFWIFTAHYYLVILTGTAILLWAARRVTESFRAPLIFVFIAILLPWIGNVAYVFKLGPWPGLNWLSISISVSGMVLAWVVLRGGLFDLLPRAQSALLDEMSDGVVILDRADNLLFTNPAAREMFAIMENPARAADAVKSLREAESQSDSAEAPFDGPSGRKWLNVRASAIRDRWGETTGQLFVIRDLTARKALEEERERLITKLEDALKTVQTLEGLLPICANCKKVRDDNGYWDQIEEYLSTHLPVRVSHGICPDCADKLYGQFRLPTQNR
ncbi:MAG: hypothetical protein KF868_12055 [Acidobacteria bacterium]|nr:hypothetical protein [Acidobacteriota bacterium]